MPKMKTKRGAAKRVKRTGSGKLRRAGGWKQHKLEKKQKKRRARGLWIIRINAACRQVGLSYSRFMAALRRAGILLDRKVLAEMAVRDPQGFAKLAETAKAQSR